MFDILIEKKTETIKQNIKPLKYEVAASLTKVGFGGFFQNMSDVFQR